MRCPQSPHNNHGGRPDAGGVGWPCRTACLTLSVSGPFYYGVRRRRESNPGVIEKAGHWQNSDLSVSRGEGDWREAWIERTIRGGHGEGRHRREDHAAREGRARVIESYVSLIAPQLQFCNGECRCIARSPATTDRSCISGNEQGLHASRA
jgi:hypothetical protein